MNARTFFAAMLVSGAALTGVGQASAMPTAIDYGGPTARVEQVRFGCGPGWRPNPVGRCVPNRAPMRRAVRRGWRRGRW